MTLKLLDKSKINEGTIEKNRVDEVCISTKKSFQIISPEKILKCERIELGILGNCALCEGTNNEIFLRCKNKWNIY